MRVPAPLPGSCRLSPAHCQMWAAPSGNRSLIGGACAAQPRSAQRMQSAATGAPALVNLKTPCLVYPHGGLDTVLSGTALEQSQQALWKVTQAALEQGA